jgi:hypothetical protein
MTRAGGWPTWTALTALALVFVAVVGTYVLAVLSGHDLSQLSFVLTTPVAAVVGGLIVARRPANPVGWCILGHALCFSQGEFCRQYALYGMVTRPGALPLAQLLASPPYWIWGPGIACGFLLWPLYFPNGRLVAPGWRLAVWYAVGVIAVTTGLMAVQTGDHETPGVPNPLGIPAITWAGDHEALDLEVLWLSSALVAAASLIVRYRRATGVERQQIRWPVYAMALALTCLLLQDRLPPVLGDLLLVLALGGLWGSIGIAILRHRLYDIDIIINRTLVYGALTATLVAIYFVAVVALQSLLRALTGQDSDLAIVASTLAVAVLFLPLRRRIQRLIDRRFYRSKFDAARVVDAYGARLRDDVDAEQIRAQLLGVVRETVRPAHASLWLWEPEERP